MSKLAIFWTVLIIAVPTLAIFYYKRKAAIEREQYSHSIESLRTTLEAIVSLIEKMHSQYGITAQNRYLINRCTKAIKQYDDGKVRLSLYQVGVHCTDAEHYLEELQEVLKKTIENRRLAEVNLDKGTKLRRSSSDLSVIKEAMTQLVNTLSTTWSGIAQRHGLHALWDSSGHVARYRNFQYLLSKNRYDVEEEALEFNENLKLVLEVSKAAATMRAGSNIIGFINENLTLGLRHTLTIVPSEKLKYFPKQGNWTSTATTRRPNGEVDEVDILMLQTANNCLSGIRTSGNEDRETSVQPTSSRHSDYDGSGGSFGGGGASGSWESSSSSSTSDSSSSSCSSDSGGSSSCD